MPHLEPDGQGGSRIEPATTERRIPAVYPRAEQGTRSCLLSPAVANATRILGAAAICSDDGGGTVSLGEDGYGTSKCTVDQLEKAAKTNSVTVRVTMDSKSGGAETVEEKYQP